MKAIHLLLPLMLLPAAALAQVSPMPSFEDPRLQTVVWQPNLPVRLVAFPDASLKLVFHRGETIRRVVLSDGNAFRAAVLDRADTLEVAALRAMATATMRVETDQRAYDFALETGEGLAAAYLVRFIAGNGSDNAVSAAEPLAGAELRNYRLKGDRSVRPDGIYDDGERTFIEWHRDRALPAVFGVGPGGVEEIVAGYMREGKFVIDRVYPELVFRFDKEKATARREEERKKK